jgi:hypothetical protein
MSRDNDYVGGPVLGRRDFMKSSAAIFGGITFSEIDLDPLYGRPSADSTASMRTRASSIFPTSSF